MRFTVATYGSEGDTRPLVALCKGLMAAGHDVRLFADRSTLASAQACGVDASALSGDMRGTGEPGGPLAKLMREGGDVTEVAKAATRIANDNTATWMEAVVVDARASDAILFSGMVSKHHAGAVFLLSIAVGLAGCAANKAGNTGLELLPPISSIGPGVAKQGSPANAKLVADTISGLESLVGEKIDPSEILKFVIQEPVGAPGSRAWREMWIVPDKGSYIITFSEDGPSAADYKIRAMK